MLLWSACGVDSKSFTGWLIKDDVSTYVSLVYFMANDIPDTVVSQWKVEVELVCVGASCQMRFSWLPTHSNLYPIVWPSAHNNQ